MAVIYHTKFYKTSFLYETLKKMFRSLEVGEVFEKTVVLLNKFPP